MATTDNASVAWLNSLSISDARALYNYMLAGSQTRLVSNSPVPADLQAYMRLNPQASSQNGAEWDVYNTCRHYVAGGRGIDVSGTYTRYQLQFKTTDVKTPVKSSAILKGLRDVLSSTAWDALKALAKANSSRKVAIMVHHIAYIYKRSWDSTLPPIPLNVGAGGSVAHLCDNHCGEPSHMFVTAQQVNMSMQHCVGVELLVKEGVIMQTLNCPHYREEDGVTIVPNCAKVKVVQLSAAIQVAPEFADAFEEAREGYFAGGI